MYLALLVSSDLDVNVYPIFKLSTQLGPVYHECLKKIKWCTNKYFSHKKANLSNLKPTGLCYFTNNKLLTWSQYLLAKTLSFFVSTVTCWVFLQLQLLLKHQVEVDKRWMASTTKLLTDFSWKFSISVVYRL